MELGRDRTADLLIEHKAVGLVSPSRQPGATYRVRTQTDAERGLVRQDRTMALAPFTLDPLLAAVRARSTGIGSHIHGELHWRTVGANGLRLARSLDGVDTRVVLLFALLHDTMRLNDGH